jgi:large subunit ribosomal protein L9
VIVNIARSLDEAQTQAKLGRALDREAMEEQRDLDEAPAAEELLERAEDAAEIEAVTDEEEQVV